MLIMYNYVCEFLHIFINQSIYLLECSICSASKALDAPLSQKNTCMYIIHIHIIHTCHGQTIYNGQCKDSVIMAGRILSMGSHSPGGRSIATDTYGKTFCKSMVTQNKKW